MDEAEKLARIEALRADSRSKFEGLARDGVTEIPGLGASRLEVVIEALLPWEDGTNHRRLDMELKWETHANEVLSQVVEQVNRAKLLQGVGTNGMGRVPPSNGRR